MKKRLLFNIALACGYLPMGVGTLILLIWWGAREFYAPDLYKLERMGGRFYVDKNFRLREVRESTSKKARGNFVLILEVKHKGKFRIDDESTACRAIYAT